VEKGNKSDSEDADADQNIKTYTKQSGKFERKSVAFWRFQSLGTGVR